MEPNELEQEVLPPGWHRGENEGGIYYEEKNRSMPAIASTPQEAWEIWEKLTDWSKEYTLELIELGDISVKLDGRPRPNNNTNKKEYWIKRATWFELRFNEERGQRARADKAEAELAALQGRVNADPVSGGDIYVAMSDDQRLKQIEVLVKLIEVNEGNDNDGSIVEGIANAKGASEKLRDFYCMSTGKELILPWEPNYVFREGFYFTGRKPS